MGLQHDNPNLLPQSPLRTQRMTADESRAVIAQWQQERVEQTGLTDRPAVPDVAEGLDIPVEEVQRLLGEVRAQRVEEERALAQEQELSEVRLAEEERKLAEIRRQRAELRREQMEAKRQYPVQVHNPLLTPSDIPWQVFVMIAVTLLLIWMVVALTPGPTLVPGSATSAVPQATCPPGMYPVPGHDASFGCTDLPPNKLGK